MRSVKSKSQCKVDIVLQIILSSGITNIRLEYRPSAISKQTATTTAHTFEKILTSIDLSETQLLGDIDALSEHDLQQILEWNRATPATFSACVHKVFEQRATESPASPAVCAWDGHLTYEELEDLSNRLAHHLSKLGVTVGSYVPFCFEKSLWTVVATMAVLKAGGAFVPLDPAQPRSRVQSIVQDLGAKIAVASPHNLALLEGLLSVIVVSPSALSDMPKSSMPELVDIRPDNTAFVLFTSGSTGKPKGIVQTHSAVCSSGLGHGSAYGIGRSTRVLQFAAHVWDVCTMDIFTTLMRGGCVCIPSDYERMNDIVGAITRMNANWAFLTPSFIKVLHPQDVRCLETLVLGGEAVTQENIGTWADKVTLFNCYGPAESAACLGVKILDRNHPAQNIGRSYSTTRCWIVDGHNHNRLAPIGAIGELVVEGPTLASGYLNNKAKTDESFISSPPWLQRARSSEQTRIYKTGDFAQYDADGSIVFHGRRDTQIKIHGQRAELTDIAHHLSAHPAVSRSVVAYPKSGAYSGTLVAVVCLKASSASTQCNGQVRLLNEMNTLKPHSDLDQFQSHLEKRLPLYMVPNVFLIVESIPLNTSAKIDRKAVETWLASLTQSKERNLPSKPRQQNHDTELGKSEVLAMCLSNKIAKMVAPDDYKRQKSLQRRNFHLTRAGIDSIQAISLSMFLGREYGVRIDIEKLINGNTTIQLLAKYIQQGGSNQDAAGSLSADGLLHEVVALGNQIRSAVVNKYCTAHSRTKPHSVFVTGGSGYLGTQILRRFFEDNDSLRVIAHVRAQTSEQGMGKIIAAAEKIKWWSAAYTSRLEIWVGDLSQTRLGLDDYQWARLCGLADETDNVDIVVHNGAAVHWSHDYETLKSTNVGATVELLKATIPSPVLTRFVYISGGQKLSIEDEEDRAMAAQAAGFSGYSQTKFVSEMLVKEVSRSQKNTGRFLVVKPSYIIGSAQQGLANVDDFVWRLLAGLIEIKGHPIEDFSSWLFMSEVDHIASTVVTHCIDNPSETDGVIKILDGIRLSDLWRMLKNELGYDLHPMTQAEILVRMRQAIEKNNKHPLYPFFYLLDKKIMNIGSSQAPNPEIPLGRRAATRLAIRKNIKYLQNIGFLPTPKRADLILEGMPASQDMEVFNEKDYDNGYLLGLVDESLPFGRSKIGVPTRQVL